MDWSRLYIPMVTPEPGIFATSYSTGSPPFSGVKTSFMLPGPGSLTSVALYWSPKAWRPMTMGSVQWGTSLGTFLMTIGSRKTVPSRIPRMVPLGDFHIFLRPNSLTLASSGVMVAHLIPTLVRKIALAASTVTWSSVASRFWMLKS